MRCVTKTIQWFTLVLSSMTLVACAILPADQGDLTVKRNELAVGSTLNIPVPPDAGRVLVRLVYSHVLRSDVANRSWGYGVRYQFAGTSYWLRIQSGVDQGSVYETVQAHDTHGPFAITIESIDAFGKVPSDIDLSFQWVGAGQTALDTQRRPNNVTVGSNGNVSWGPIVGAEAYEVQWVFVDADNEVVSALQAFFAYPTATIEVQTANAHLNLDYQAGVVHVRVRAIGKFSNGGTLRKGPWSDVASCTVEANTKLDETRTWLRSTDFDNAGASRTSVWHYDSLLRQRQHVSTSRPDGITRISGTVVDDEGRSALTTSAVPVDGESLAYRAGFISSTEHVFSSEDLRSELPPVLAASGAGEYFRAGNEMDGVPEETRPYVTKAFTHDYRDRPRRSAGIGTALHLNPSRFLYGTAGAEFRQLFGASGGMPGNYTRDVFQDPDGQGHVRYSDPDGRLVAVGLVGGTPASFSPLPENPIWNGSAATIRTQIDIPRSTLDPLRPVDEYAYTLVNVVPGTKYSFDYALNGTTSSVILANDQLVCPSCKYRITITVYKQNGQIVGCNGSDPVNCSEASSGSAPISWAQYSAKIPPPATSACSNGGTLKFAITLNDLSEYKIVRRIELDRSAIDTYIDEHTEYIPGVPDREDLAEQAASYGYSECALRDCQGVECKAMVEEMAARRCDALEALARADMQSEDQGFAAADFNYACPTEPAGTEGESTACCHVRQCRRNQDIAANTMLWQIELAKITDWDSANQKGMLDPLGDANRPPGIQPCMGVLCRDREGMVARSQILQRMQEYRVDPFTGGMMNLWDYVRRPQLGLDTMAQWSAFRGAYLALRAQALVDAQNASSCPFNDVVQAPDLSGLNASTEVQEQDALVGFAEHCVTQCAANVCNWRWQLSDRCDSYNPFDSDGDGRNDFPAYMCGPDTPGDAVENHLTSYCLRQCGLQNPFGSISTSDLETDVDLLAVQEAAHCSLEGIADGLFESNVICLENCESGLVLTGCGRLVSFYLSNWKLRQTNPEYFLAQLDRLRSECLQATTVGVNMDTLLLGGQCRFWAVDVRGNRIAFNDIGNGFTISNVAPETINTTLRTQFTGLVFTTRNGHAAYVMSNCSTLLTEYKGPCCKDKSFPQRGGAGNSGVFPVRLNQRADATGTLHSLSKAKANAREASHPDVQSDDAYVCTEVDSSAALIEAKGTCSQEMLSKLQDLIASTNTPSPLSHRCVGEPQYQGSLIQFKGHDGKYCWFQFLAGKLHEPWVVESDWILIETNPVALPSSYPRTTTQNVGDEEILLSYTGTGITLENEDHKRVTIYVYSNCPLLLGPECTPVDGSYTLNLPPFEFGNWVDQCNDDAESFQDAQIARIVHEGQEEAISNFRTEMTARCMGGAVSEKILVEYQSAEYAHTLYYYDQVGNLTAVVPPNGVHPLPIEDGTIDTLSIPNHQMLTRQWYDSRNNIIRQSSPDAGEARFIYDSRSRRRFAQTSEQKTRNEWSYTKYDGLDRIVEKGVIGPYDEGYVTTMVDDVTFPTGVNRREVVRWSYGPVLTDNSSTDVFHESNDLRQGSYLRGRIRGIGAIDSGVEQSYGYTPTGQVKQLTTYQPGLGEKTARYIRDPVDDALLAVEYQVAEEVATRHDDEFHQRYEYDSERRLVSVSTSNDGVIWNRDARYAYYDHGPIKRLTLGEYEVQGIDYVHTIQGWLKAVNGGDGSPESDLGEDGLKGGPHPYVPQDVISLLYKYYDNDFKPMSAPFQNVVGTDGVFASDGKPSLYSGLIRNRILLHRGLPKLQRLVRSAYDFDQLARLNASTTTMPKVIDSPFETGYTYDLNGNLRTVMRKGAVTGECAGPLDKLTYSYQNGSNRLLHINDAVAHDICNSDLDDQGSFNANGIEYPNYAYDKDGRLVSDRTEQIKKVSWTATGKVEDIQRTTPPLLIEFAYDGMDRRMRKTTPEMETFYVRHPDGRILATYEKREKAGVDVPAPKEYMIYAGGRRLGTRLAYESTSGNQFERVGGFTRYELIDQVGSVLAVISDVKTGYDDDGDGVVDRYSAKIISSADYYPFGMLKPKQQSTGFLESRFGFDGYEKDDDIKGTGKSYITEARYYDPRVGRWWTTDPILFGDSGFYAFDNNPINLVDPSGLAAMDSPCYACLQDSGIRNDTSLDTKSSLPTNNITLGTGAYAKQLDVHYMLLLLDLYSSQEANFSFSKMDVVPPTGVLTTGHDRKEYGTFPSGVAKTPRLVKKIADMKAWIEGIQLASENPLSAAFSLLASATGRDIQYQAAAARAGHILFSGFGSYAALRAGNVGPGSVEYVEPGTTFFSPIGTTPLGPRLYTPPALQPSRKRGYSWGGLILQTTLSKASGKN